MCVKCQNLKVYLLEYFQEEFQWQTIVLHFACNNILCDMQNFGMCQFDACQLFTDTLHPYEKK